MINNVYKYRGHRNIFGFTLAEILISLVIVGVIAVLVLPTLISKIQEIQFKEQAKEAYSKASQAVQHMKNDNGGSLSDYYSWRSFKPTFMKAFKVIKDCNWDDCVPEASTIYKTLSGYQGSTSFLIEGQFITDDGIFWAINSHNSDKIQITIDVNGYQKGPNAFGKDVFMFETVNDILLPMGADSTSFQSAQYCDRTDSTLPYGPDFHDDFYKRHGGFGCMANIMNGIDY